MLDLTNLYFLTGPSSWLCSSPALRISFPPVSYQWIQNQSQFACHTFAPASGDKTWVRWCPLAGWNSHKVASCGWEYWSCITVAGWQRMDSLRPRERLQAGAKDCCNHMCCWLEGISARENHLLYNSDLHWFWAFVASYMQLKGCPTREKKVLSHMCDV